MILLRRALILLLLLTPVFLFSQEITENFEGEPEGDIVIEEEFDFDIEEIRRRILQEDPGELMSISLGDSNVSLSLTGTWKGSLQGNIGIIYSPLGTAFTSPETPLLFSQEADILVSLWINNRWFVEANFLDDSSQNTYRAGYQGQSGDFIKYAGIGNTGLDFPAFPYLDLGGDSVSSFGFYGRMGTDSLNIHSLFRYDAASREERIFTGNRERTMSYIQPQNFIRGVSFVLPEYGDDIGSEISVYIEDPNGTIFDQSNKRWRLLLHSEYAAGSREGLLELGIRPAGMVAVFYSGVGNNLGSYSGTGFLREVQNFFGNDANLGSTDYVNFNNGITALVIYRPGTFSPFEKLNRYDAPSSASEQANVVWMSSNTVKEGYELAPISGGTSSGDIPLYIQAVSQRNVYELLSVNIASARDPENRWPLAEEYPEIYIPPKSVYTGDTGLRFINYSGTNGFFLGQDVVQGSVQVWRSGIQDSNFKFNAATGEVVLNSPAGMNEIIRITYLKKSEETRIGSIAAGIGAHYRQGSNPFSAMAAIGVRWNVTESDAFTEEGNSSIGTVGLSGKVQWDYDNLKAHIAAGFAFEQTDTTGLYRVAGMEGHKVILPLPADTSFLSYPPAGMPSLSLANRKELIYKNYYNNNVLGSTLMPITWNGAVVVTGVNKPYPVKDPLLSDSQILVADFILEAGEWTGFQVPTVSNSDFISRAGEIIIPYRLIFDSAVPIGFKLIIQIGDLSSKDFSFIENTDIVWQEEMDLSNIDEHGRGIAIISLTEADRLKLSSANHLRVIAVSESGEAAGRVLLASPVFHGASFRSLNSEVMAYETIETEPPFLHTQFADIINRLHTDSSSQRVLAIEWDNLEPGKTAGVDGRIGEIPLNDYRELSFFIKLPGDSFIVTDEKLIFIVASGPEAIGREYLKAEIPLNEFANLNLQGQWAKVTIRYQGSETGVFINGTRINGITPEYNPVRAAVQSNPVNYTCIYIDPGTAGQLAPGIFYIDEIILEDPCVVYRLNAGTAVEYSKQGVLLSLNGLPVFSDLKISTAVESEIRMDEENNNMGSMVNRTGLQISIFGVNLQANAAFTAAENTFLWSADHSISRTLGSFSVKESFYASPQENNAQHKFNLSYTSDFFAKFDADALYELSRLRQKWNFGIGYRPKNEVIPAISFNSDLQWVKNNNFNEDNDYAALWLQSFMPLIPDTGKGANSRKTVSQFVITQRTKPIGAVLTLNGITNFTAINSLTQTENSLFLDIPVTLTRTNINFRMGRNFKRHLDFTGNDIMDDADRFFNSIDESLHLWKIFPGYSLFAPELNNAMDNIKPANYTAFNDHFSTTVTLPRRTDLTAFIVPSRATFRLERQLEQKMDTRSDILNMGISFGFSAINMFGSMGYKPLFNFYTNDEFNHAIQGAVAFNNNAEISWRAQSVLGAGFRTANGTMNIVNTLTLRDGDRWTESFAVDWITPAEKTLINLLYRFISKAAVNQKTWPGLSSLLSSEYRQLRKETLEFTIEKTQNYFNQVAAGPGYYRWNAAIGHEEIIRIMGRLEFTGFVKLRLGEDTYRETVIFDALIGTTLRISF
ncbi:MAG: hypothetical protein LBU88_06800 [Treponema sp.]|jgi:hypothetical protein|nr:hypothetical protein [Treponema sp.]